MVAQAFVDTETVRLGTEHGSAVWEIAVIARDDSGDTEYLWQVRPSLEHADAMALRIGRYYERCEVADKPVGYGKVLAGPKVQKGKTVARAGHLIALDVAKLLDGALIVGANPWFDAGHLDVFLRAHGQALSADYHMVDVGSVIAGYKAGKGERPPVGMKLTEAARAVGIDPDKYKTHTALGDTRLTVAIWDRVFA